MMGVVLSFFAQAVFPPRPKFSVDDIPDLTGKVAIVTGGNAGIGQATVKALLEHNATVYMCARDVEKGKAAIEELRKSTGKEAGFIQLDLASLASVRRAAEDFGRRETQLHILINNAGVMSPPLDMLTEDGYDLQMGTNVVGPFLFTKLLLPKLIATAKTSGQKTRIVNISSISHLAARRTASMMNYFRDSPVRRKVGTNGLYAQSKFAVVLVTKELARRYDEYIVASSVHPGTIASDVGRHVRIPFLTLRIIMASPSNDSCYPGEADLVTKNVFFPGSEKGALTQLYAATSPEAENGGYFIPWARLGRAHSGTEDPVLARELWDYLDEQVSRQEGFDPES